MSFVALAGLLVGDAALAQSRGPVGASRGAAWRGVSQVDTCAQGGAPSEGSSASSECDRKASELVRQGRELYKRNRFEDSIRPWEEALAIYESTGDSRAVAATLVDIGVAYDKRGLFSPAVTSYRKAERVSREIGDRAGQALALRNIGSAYRDLGQYPTSLRSLLRALAIYQEIGDRVGEAYTSGSLGLTHFSLGANDRALEHLQRALDLSRGSQDLQGEANALNDLGNVYRQLGDHRRSIASHERSLAIKRRLGDLWGEAASLNNLGFVHFSLGRYRRAVEYHEQGLAIQRRIGNRAGQAISLNNLGNAHRALGAAPRAIECYQQSLSIQHEIGDREGEARSLGNLGTIYGVLGRPDIAAAFLKRAVNAYQAIREDNSSLSKELQSSYTGSVSQAYRALADVLVESGRLGEAERVMKMIKEREFFDFAQRDAADDPRRTTMGYSPQEALWQARYDEIGGRVAALGEEYDRLDRLVVRDAAQQARWTQLAADMDVARKAFLASLAELDRAFASQAAERAKDYGRLNLDSSETLQGELERLPEGTVIVHYLVLPDKVHILFTSRTVQLHREASLGGKAITEAALNRMVAQFRDRLTDPGLDPRSAGKALYDALVAPIAADLQQAGARTVMLSLDGALRLLPFAALWDGKQYLVQRFSLPVYTAAASAALDRVPTATWTVAAMGVSKAESGFAPLPAVPVELDAIVRDGAGGADEGVLGGTVRLDERFTVQGFTAALAARPPVVHIASHFSFSPGTTEADSFLLLGGGERLTLADMRTGSGFRMTGVELLTLSACETALGDVRGAASGREVEGFGALAQGRGAASVMATLWSVADGSTGLFMREFYRTREADHLDKAESMRRVQLGFISGALRPDTAPASLRGAIRVRDPATAKRSSDAPFITRSEAPFAHPFFWAPFILMGNWL